MNYPPTPTTQAVGLGFASPPLRGCGLQVEISFELETPGQHTFRTLHNIGDSALWNRLFHPFICGGLLLGCGDYQIKNPQQ